MYYISSKKILDALARDNGEAEISNLKLLKDLLRHGIMMIFWLISSNSGPYRILLPECIWESMSF